MDDTGLRPTRLPDEAPANEQAEFAGGLAILAGLVARLATVRAEEDR